MRLWPPEQLPPTVVLRSRVGVPAAATDELTSRLRLAVHELILELTSHDVHVIVNPSGEHDR